MAAFVELHARWGRHHVPFRLRRADVKRLRIVVEPDGTVAVTAPSRATDAAVIARVTRRGDWIQRQREYFARWRPKTPCRQYLSGETHLFLGRQLRLEVARGQPHGVAISGNQLIVRANDANNRKLIRNEVDAWYANQARTLLRKRFAEQCRVWRRQVVIEPRLVVRTLKNRWGSYTAAGTLTLNAELVRASPRLIDYVIAHELAHAIHPDHGSAWCRLLTRMMPDWVERKTKLERQLL